MPSSSLANDSFRNHSCFSRNLDLAQILLADWLSNNGCRDIDRSNVLHRRWSGRLLFLVHVSLPGPFPEEQVIGLGPRDLEPQHRHAPKTPGRALRSVFVGASARENKRS
jgi:hypothetical protein